MNAIKAVLIFLGQCIIILFLFFVARELWRASQDEKQAELFDKVGQPVNVVVDRVIKEKKDWKDYIGNSKYLGFQYHDHPYSVRFVQDTAWVGEGSRVELLYDPGADAFRQQRSNYVARRYMRKSKLVDFTVLMLFKTSTAYLIGCIAINAILFLMLSGMIARLTGWTILDRMLNLLFYIFFFVGVIYLTYNTYAFYRLIRQIRSGGTEISLTLLDKYRESFGNDARHSYNNLYYYTARIHYENDDRIIRISGDEYETLKVGEPIRVFYNKDLDEIMSVNFKAEYFYILGLVLIWAVFIFMCVQALRKLRKRE